MARNTYILIIAKAWNLLHVLSSGQLTSESEEYCQYETFQPRCLKNEIIRIESATYGRMRVGRCITAAEVDEQKTLSGDVSRFIGCSADVLPLLDRKCSGKTECDIRVIDMSREKATPCFPGLNVYLEVSYGCIHVADEERSCSATASVVPIHIIGSSDGPQRICGTKSQPWTIEAPVGQKIRISLLDFRASRSGHIEELSKPSCHSYGVIVDKTSKRNVTICGGGSLREKELYTSTGNAIEIFLSHLDQTENTDSKEQFLIKVEAVGCSDLIPPEDAWLKRSDDSIVIGCYSSRQTWYLHCEGEKWIGVFGNCSQGEVHDTIVDTQPKTETWTDEQVLTMVAVGGFTLTICLAVLCTGIVCLRRYSAQNKKRHDYRTLNFSTARKPVQFGTGSDNIGNDSRVLATQEMPTYSVFIGENDPNTIDNSLGYNSQPSVPL